VVPAGRDQAVRAVLAWGGGSGACTTGPYDDRDDLAFQVGGGP